jgi:hypothetical protein
LAGLFRAESCKMMADSYLLMYSGLGLGVNPFTIYELRYPIFRKMSHAEPAKFAMFKKEKEKNISRAEDAENAGVGRRPEMSLAKAQRRWFL